MKESLHKKFELGLTLFGCALAVIALSRCSPLVASVSKIPPTSPTEARLESGQDGVDTFLVQTEWVSPENQDNRALSDAQGGVTFERREIRELLDTGKTEVTVSLDEFETFRSGYQKSTFGTVVTDLESNELSTLKKDGVKFFVVVKSGNEPNEKRLSFQFSHTKEGDLLEKAVQKSNYLGLTW